MAERIAHVAAMLDKCAAFQDETLLLQFSALLDEMTRTVKLLASEEKENMIDLWPRILTTWFSDAFFERFARALIVETGDVLAVVTLERRFSLLLNQWLKKSSGDKGHSARHAILQQCLDRTEEDPTPFLSSLLLLSIMSMLSDERKQSACRQSVLFSRFYRCRRFTMALALFLSLHSRVLFRLVPIRAGKEEARLF